MFYQSVGHLQVGWVQVVSGCWRWSNSGFEPMCNSDAWTPENPLSSDFITELSLMGKDATLNTWWKEGSWSLKWSTIQISGIDVRNFGCMRRGLGQHDILHVIVIRISSEKPVLWLVVNLHHLLSDGAAFNTQSHSSRTNYAIPRSLSKVIHLLWAWIA